MTVVQLPTAISISGPGSVNVGEAIQLSAAVSPDSTRDKSVIWSSEDPNIAVVDQDGKVTGKAAGSTFIYAESEADGTVTGRKTITVNVLPESVSIAPSSATMDIGGQLTLTATVSPGNASDKTVTWSTGDSSVATVSNGVVTARAAGSAVITATTINGKTGSITVTVRQPYTLNFNVNANDGSCSISSVTVYSGYAIGNVLPTPTRNNNTFNGWWTAPSGGTRLTSSWSTVCSTSYTVYAHWTPIPITITFNANGGSCSEGSKKINKGTAIGTMPNPTRTHYTFNGWFTAASDGIPISTATIFNSDTTLYAQWVIKNYTYSIEYKSTNGTILGSTSMTKAYGTTNTVTPPSFAGYNTPAAQSVKWDAASKTVTFTYSPVAAVVTKVSNVHFATYNSGEETYSAEITVGERTATSVQIKIKVTFRLPAGAYNAYAHKLTGKLDNTSIAKKTIVSLNRWASASSSVRTEYSVTPWITVPVTATQTTVNANLILRLYNSSDTYMSNLAHTEKNVTVNIPGY